MIKPWIRGAGYPYPEFVDTERLGNAILQVLFETTITCEVLPKNTTSTAQYAAVAVKTSCFLAFVKIEQKADAAKVNKKMVRT